MSKRLSAVLAGLVVLTASANAAELKCLQHHAGKVRLTNFRRIYQRHRNQGQLLALFHR